MLLSRETSCLLLIDVQEKLAHFVREAQALLSRCEWVIRLAKDLKVPCLITEQYPQGLGATVKPLLDLCTTEKAIDKIQFSCARAPDFKKQLEALGRKQLILIGIETHVCVLQTAMDLHQEGYEVYVVVDAVSSRSELDYKYALKRMKQAGIHLVTSEMVFFEWIGQAGTPEFKAMSKAYLQ